MLECVVNVSEGRDRTVLRELADAAGHCLLDLHVDAHHHRSVLTLAGPDVEARALAVAAAAVERIDLRAHRGVHPRFGVVDVVPFVPLREDGAPDFSESGMAEAIRARDRVAAAMAQDLGLPCFLYGPQRTLPDIRRQAFTTLAPDVGPSQPDPRRGACAVGARPVLVAYNLWLDSGDLAGARAIAAEVRGPALRTLGLAVGAFTQVSCNLVRPLDLGPSQAYDAVARAAAGHGIAIARSELVGLVPAAVLEATEADRALQLDLDADRTIEARWLAARRAGG